jgi:hypothetical protein
MATRRQALGVLVKPALALFHDLGPPADGGVDQLVRLLLTPSATRRFRQTPECRRPCCRPMATEDVHKPPDRAPDMRKFTIASSSSTRLDGRGEIGRKLLHLVIADEAGHVQRVDAAIGELPRNARHRGIIAPAHARVVGIGRIAVVAVAEVPSPPAAPCRDRRARTMARMPAAPSDRRNSRSSPRTDPAVLEMRTISSPSSTVMVIGFSHST